MNSLTALFCDVDDFCQRFVLKWERMQIIEGDMGRRRAKMLCLSEIMAILIEFNRNHYLWL